MTCGLADLLIKSISFEVIFFFKGYIKKASVRRSEKGCNDSTLRKSLLKPIILDSLQDICSGKALQCSHQECMSPYYLPSESRGVLHPIQVLLFFVKAASPPIFDMTTVLVLVCSPSERERQYYEFVLLHIYLCCQDNCFVSNNYKIQTVIRQLHC